VHESVHGFIHRYRSHVHIPSWINEGLAEVIGYQLVPQPQDQKERRARTKDYVSQVGMGPGFYERSHINGDQYPVAENLASFMIASSKTKYVAFINAIKDGMEVKEAMETKFGVTEARLTEGFRQSLGLKPAK
jgi:hypothetical protein